MAPDRNAIDAIRKQFYEHGVTVADWAREHGFDAHLVYSVLNGRSRAQRGESHRIAIALGLKKAFDTELFPGRTGRPSEISTNESDTTVEAQMSG
ncbi:DNA-binding protein [Massilia sp. CCM 8693]|uniref:DNA-binding protein n=2 Tax=Massilia aquatica TaxID=2609000 RepID=A0ABX0MD93_9BURK|nr:DNA-binding protein [Massilia aquatica]